MTDTITLTREQYGLILDGLNEARECTDKLHELADAFGTIGMFGLGIRIAKIGGELAGHTIGIQSVLLAAEEGQAPDFNDKPNREA